MASPFGDPPPGIDLYDSHTARNNAVTISMTALATVARGVALGRIGLEAGEWFIVAALVPTYESSRLYDCRFVLPLNFL